MPVTQEQHERKLEDPALCEQLPVRDYLDNVAVRSNGAFVAGYELRGITSYFGSDEERDRGKVMIGALLKSIPEQSMRMQVRYEVVEDVGNLLDLYTSQDRSGNDVARALDRFRLEAWRRKVEAGHYLRPVLHIYFIWDPKVHHRVTGKADTPRNNLWSLSSRACIERSRQDMRNCWPSSRACCWGLRPPCRRRNSGPGG
jgi:hypothetical protein